MLKSFSPSFIRELSEMYFLHMLHTFVNDRSSLFYLLSAMFVKLRHKRTINFAYIIKLKLEIHNIINIPDKNTEDK